MSAPPREGLPPCGSRATFDGRQASLNDLTACPDRYAHGPAISGNDFYVIAGFAKGEKRNVHGETFISANFIYHDVISLITDDRSEAEAAYARGCEWVRTGELP